MIFLGQVLLVGLIYGLILKPFSISDELTHFMNGYHIANIIQQKHDVKTDKIQGEFDVYEIHYRDIDEDLFFENSLFVYDFSYDNVINFSLADKPLFEMESTYNSREILLTRYFPFPEYTIMGLSIAVGRMVGFSSLYLVWFVRIVNMLFYALICAWAIKLLPFAKAHFYIIMLLPVGMYNICSTSYHTILYAETFLLFSIILHAKFKTGYISMKEWISILFLLAIIAPAKGVFLFYFVFAFLITKDKFKSKNIYYIYLVSVFLVSVSFWLGYNLHCYDVTNAINTTANYTNTAGEVPKEGLSGFVTVVMTFIRNFTKTVFVRGFYIDRSISQIKFDTGSLSFCLSIFAFIMTSYYDSSDQYKMTNKNKVLILLSYMLSYGLMSFVGYIAMKSTKITDLIELKSVYCYQFLPLVGLCIRPKKVFIIDKKTYQTYTVAIVAMIHACIFFTVAFNAMIL